MIDHTTTPRSTPGGRGLGWRGSSPFYASLPRFAPDPALLTTPPPPASTNATTRPGWLLPQPSEQQGREGSCTAWATRKMVYWAYNQAGWHNPFPPSARYIYYTERQVLQMAPYNITGATQEDTGGYSEAAIAATAQYGVTADDNCPYAPPSGDPLVYLTVPPADFAYTNAHRHLDVANQAVVQARPHMQAALLAGHPFIVGISVFSGFESLNAEETGVVTMPNPGEKPYGGHELFCIDYETRTPDANSPDGLYYVVLGSWGNYGDKGKMYLPAPYLEDPNLADGLVTILRQF
ncbi:MAG: hypothetical protein KGL39_39200 [Patescibacteria group bacterium]|nr:hypothetical protein [Patescibacteria group bacterium]